MTALLAVMLLAQAPAPETVPGRAFEKGQPIRIIGAAYGSSTIVFVVKTDSPIRVLADLNEKKIGHECNF